MTSKSIENAAAVVDVETCTVMRMYVLNVRRVIGSTLDFNAKLFSRFSPVVFLRYVLSLLKVENHCLL